MWVGGSMDLRDGAATMSLDGRSPGRPLPGVDQREVLFLGLFPNLLLSLHPDYVMTHRMTPLAPDRTQVECAWYFPGVMTSVHQFVSMVGRGYAGEGEKQLKVLLPDERRRTVQSRVAVPVTEMPVSAPTGMSTVSKPGRPMSAPWWTAKVTGGVTSPSSRR